jgi:hypothetical protein
MKKAIGVICNKMQLVTAQAHAVNRQAAFGRSARSEPEQ